MNINLTENIIFLLKHYDYKWKFKLIIAAPIMTVLILLDWIVKWIVVATMQQGESKNFIKGFLNLRYVINLGSAYGNNDSGDKLAQTIVLATLFVVALMIVFVFLNDKKWIITCSVLLAGGFANLLARSWAPANIDGIHGGVVDMFMWDFNFLGSGNYIFNLADMLVNIGIGIGAICLIIEIVNMFRPNKEKAEEEVKNEIQS
ncbi:signal peptidase II [Mesoplasma melaleucae]|uniref:Lipoprotein signal peptidase n=1 Tax=Mesoplasma melaleucae TaxID=81459 RepID=A0A2K8NZK9_9MOLU|nr:signal peptidase II [Mesoplasma melaleucae]ATZ18073.1 signal peptidase II [Mesoplasma melaleucae]